SDDGAIEDNRTHADEAAGLNGAAVQDGIVSHADVVADEDAVLFLHAVEDTVVLNVGIVADADLVDVAAKDGVHPDAGVFAEDDVADELGGVVDVAGVGELGSDALVGADHSCECGSERSLSCDQKTYHGAIAEDSPWSSVVGRLEKPRAIAPP